MRHSGSVAVDTKLERVILVQHKSKPKMCEDFISDALSLRTGWMGEERSTFKWPSINYKANYLKILGPHCKKDRC